MRTPLTGRRALVTGASGGIGGAIALSLARAGAEVVLTYSSHRDDAEAVGRSIRELGGRAPVIRSDLGTPHAGRELVELVTADVGPIDVLVANAGVGRQATWEQVDDELWDQTFAVNVTASWQLTRAAAPGMVDRGFGRILYVSSIDAITGGVIGPHYAASKAALHGLMHHMATRLAPSGVTVNAIAPALIAGTRILPAGAADRPPIPIPVGHLGSTQDVAAMALAMLTNPYLTNKLITLDGGIHPS